MNPTLKFRIDCFLSTGFITPGQTLSRTALQIGANIPPTPSTVVPSHAERRTENLGATAKDF
jgi:hypothetical protein